MKPTPALLWLFSWLPAVASEPPAFEAFRSPTPTLELNVELRPAADWSAAGVFPETAPIHAPSGIGESGTNYLVPAPESTEAVRWWREFRPGASAALVPPPETLPRARPHQLPAIAVACAALFVAVAGSVLRRRLFGRWSDQLPGVSDDSAREASRKPAVV